MRAAAELISNPRIARTLVSDSRSPKSLPRREEGGKFSSSVPSAIDAAIFSSQPPIFESSPKPMVWTTEWSVAVLE